MRVRTYGLILLGLAGIAPLGVYGWLTIQASQDTSKNLRCAGNQRLAEAIAGRLHNFVFMENDLLHTIGVAIVQSDDPKHTLDAFQLSPRNDQFEELAVYTPADAGGEPVLLAGAAPQEPPKQALFREMARDALRGETRYSGLELANTTRGDARLLTIAAPVIIAGRLSGAIVSSYNTMGIWEPVNNARPFGEAGDDTGYVAIITRDGDLLAHGNPDQRRGVFEVREDEIERVRSRSLQLLAAARDWQDNRVCRPAQGLLASAAPLRFYDRFADSGEDNDQWYVLVEQPAAVAFAETQQLVRNLFIVGIGVILGVLLTGVLIGRVLVHAIEHLRGHTRVLSEDLTAIVKPRSRLVEVRALAGALNDMAADLIRERDAARERERLNTFARVAAGLAHDLRLPIETVHGACELVKASPDDERARVLLSKVTERDLPRLKRYVDDLQRLARRGDLALDYDSVTVRALIDDICTELQATPKWQGVDFATEGQSGLAMLDQNLIRRAIVNLAGNAADACLSKGRGNRVTIEISDTKNNDFIDIRVHDTGSGIPAERLDALLSSSEFVTTKRSTGVGLGLSVVRQIVRAHKGELLISSRVDEGSTFTLRLPRVRPGGQRRSSATPGNE